MQKHGTIHRTSQIIALDPIFIDNLLHAGVCLKTTDLALNCHSQIIIGKGHPLAPLIIKHCHQTNLHYGREQTQSSTRYWFWIPSCRGIINKVLKQCSYCKRRGAKPWQPFMTNIPSDQLAVNEKLFSNSGVDYFGPILIKSSRHTIDSSISKKIQSIIYLSYNLQSAFETCPWYVNRCISISTT